VSFDGSYVPTLDHKHRQKPQHNNVCVQLPTYADNVALHAFTRHCCSNWLILVSAAHRAYSSKPAARCCSGRIGQVERTDRQTDEQPDSVSFHTPCSTYCASSGKSDRETVNASAMTEGTAESFMSINKNVSCWYIVNGWRRRVTLPQLLFGPHTFGTSTRYRVAQKLTKMLRFLSGPQSMSKISFINLPITFSHSTNAGEKLTPTTWRQPNISNQRCLCNNQHFKKRPKILINNWKGQCNSQLLLHPFNGRLPRTTWVSQYQKGKTSLDLNEARDYGVWGWQWHQLDNIQTICTLHQTDNHTNTSPNFYRPDALPDAQPTMSELRRQISATVR